MENKKEIICTNCGYHGEPKTKVNGSSLIEFLLLLLGIIPGVIYSLWRRFSPIQICPVCKKDTVIPLDSPNGQFLLKKINK